MYKVQCYLHMQASPGILYPADNKELLNLSYYHLAIKILLQLEYFYLPYCCFNNSVLSSLRLDNVAIDSCHYFASLKITCTDKSTANHIPLLPGMAGQVTVHRANKFSRVFNLASVFCFCI